VLNVDKIIAEKTLCELHLTTGSVLGSVVFNTAGIVVEKWIRLFGSGNDALSKNISTVNKENDISEFSGFLLVADDVIGGLFAMNTGRYNEQLGNIWYFAPDTLDWEPLNMQYSEFFSWVISGNTNDFYNELRWSTWQEDVQNIEFNQALLIYPFLWSKESKNKTTSKKIVPTKELLSINIDFYRQFSQ